MTAIGMRLFSHQAAAHQELLIRARTFFVGHWKSLPIKTRWHSLIIGPTGSGKSAIGNLLKTALGTEFGTENGVGLLRINTSGWMPSGAHNRAVAETIGTIIEHVHSHPKTILFLDELDKLWHETSWNNYIRGELFELLDGRFPVGAKGTTDSSLEVDDEGVLTLSQRIALTEKLCSSTFIVGAGTFQEFYDAGGSSQKIGFHQDFNSPTKNGNPTAEVIAKKLPRELLNRFNSSLLIIPQLEPAQYQILAEEAAHSLPAWIRPAFKQAARIRMQQAIAAKSGCRFVEEALADALRCTPAPTPDQASTDLAPWD